MKPSQERAAGRTVADAMLRTPKVRGPATTVAQAREALRNEHVHAVLIVQDGALLSVVERPDLESRPDTLPARLAGCLTGRTIRPDADLQATWRAMADAHRRRLAVIDQTGGLVGLLCLKRTGRGFCSDSDIRSRAEERLRRTP